MDLPQVRVGRWTIAWRRLHAKHPLVVEFIEWSPFVGLYAWMGASGGLGLWFPFVFAALAVVRVSWDYRPGGRGRRRLQANRADPVRGFEGRYPSD